jgi:hypothetical protein
MKHFLNISFLILPLLVFSQVQEDFTDGDFSANPSWTGTTATFNVNGSKQLQLNDVATSSSYLVTTHNLISLDNKEWRFYAKQSFAGSSSNFSKIYLTAASSDLNTNPDGYYILLGESLTTDAVRLFKSVGGTSTEICAGTAGAIANSANLGIRVVRDNAGNWDLYVDYTGGINYIFQSTGTDATNLVGTHAGFMCVYTSSNATKFYYDDIYIGNEVVDTQAPTVSSTSVINATNVDLLFNEAIDQTTGETVSNYVINPANIVVSANRDASNFALVHLSLQTPLVNGASNEVTISNVEDISGNSVVHNAIFTFLQAQTPEKGDVIINEFMSDPSPVLGLPEYEFVEIYNRSNKIFNLNGWKIGDNASDGTIGNAWLIPGEYKILCGSTIVDSFLNTVAVTSFPSLNNTGDDIVLKDNNGIVIDKISYTDSWFQDEVKKEGGYSLELINPEDPCSDETNWRASNSSEGGTPSLQNSIFDVTPDTQAPSFKTLLASSPNVLEVIFSEGLDSAFLVNSVLTFNPSLTVTNLVTTESAPKSVTYTFQENLVGSQQYQITMNNVADCWANTTNLIGNFVLPETPIEGDLVINEILFNPLTSGYDFVEIRNNSTKWIDLYNLQLGNFDDDTISNLKLIEEHFILKEGQYVVLTSDSLSQLQVYPFAIPGRFIQMSLPSFNNDSGTVYLVNNQLVLDKVSYLEDWHFQLLDDFDGKSLERIDPFGKSNDIKNWHTAAEAVSFATPGSQNSQYSVGQESGKITLTSETFSPDNDGFEDVMQINYEMQEAGMIGTIRIYDDRGRSVKDLVKSELLAIKGSFNWDGITDNNQKASIGTYVIYFESFNSEGKIFTMRKTFVLAGKL